MTERWRYVPGYERVYAVSDLGRVRSFKRNRVRVMKGSKAGDGYRKVILCGGGADWHVYIHRLVLSVFVGPCPAGMEACHGNADREDNRLSNLRWDTPHENNLDIIRNGNNFEASKTHCPRNHPLAHPNLVVGEIRRSGGRKCRACNQARAILQRRGGDMQAISDECYASILQEVA